MIRSLTSGPARPFLFLSLGLLFCPAAQALSPLLERALPAVVLQAPSSVPDGAPGVTLPSQDAAVLVLARTGDTGQAFDLPRHRTSLGVMYAGRSLVLKG